MDPRYQQSAGGQQDPQAYAPAQATPAPYAAPQAKVAKVHSWKDRLTHPNTTSKIVTASIVVAALTLAGTSGLQTLQNQRAAAAEQSVVASDKYQAVFLTNGQVYFGKIKEVNGEFIKLSEIYYLQQQADQSADKKDNAQANLNQQTQVSLAKLGEELHGPEDVMYISKQQVLFWENLKTKGKVTEAISEHKKTQKQ